MRPSRRGGSKTNLEVIHKLCGQIFGQLCYKVQIFERHDMPRHLCYKVQIYMKKNWSEIDLH